MLLPRYSGNAAQLATGIETSSILTFPYDFGNAAWTKSNSTITTDTIKAPNGRVEADSLNRTLATGEAIARYTTTAATSTMYTQSVYAKAGTAQWVKVRGLWATSTSSTTATWFNVATGAVGTKEAGITGARAIYVGDGWWLCQIYATSQATIGNNFADFGVSNADNSDNGTAGEYLHIWGASLKAGYWMV